MPEKTVQLLFTEAESRKYRGDYFFGPPYRQQCSFRKKAGAIVSFEAFVLHGFLPGCRLTLSLVRPIS